MLGWLKTYGNINYSDARPEVGVWLRLINESMLTPVPDHQPQPHNAERDEEYENSGATVHVGEHGIIKDVACNLTATCF